LVESWAKITVAKELCFY